MRKNLLYARRLLGDIGPLNIDPVRRLPGRIIAPAVSITGVYQDYDEASDTKHYNIGSRMVVDDRVFHYGKAGNTLNCDLGAKNDVPQHVAYAAVAATGEDSYTIIVTVGAGDGAEGDGDIAEDELKNGYIVIFQSEESINRRIVGNTAVDGGGAMTVTMDRPLPRDVEATDRCECMASPYLTVTTSTLSYSSVVGMPPIPATIGQYLWLQTWGPVWIAPQPEVSVGLYNRQVVFRHDGSIDEHDYNDAMTTKQQHCGFVLANAQAGGQGAAFIMLQLAP